VPTMEGPKNKSKQHFSFWCESDRLVAHTNRNYPDPIASH
jgi:hypothetical protein